MATDTERAALTPIKTSRAGLFEDNQQYGENYEDLRGKESYRNMENYDD